MKKIFILLLTTALFAGCTESFLDTDPLTSKTNTDYYQTTTDMDQALTAAYVTLVSVPSGSILNAYPFAISELMSDDRFGGGGDNDLTPRAICDFKIDGQDMYLGAWIRYYRGIFRCNMLLENIDKPAWPSAAAKGNIEGQARFLRAMFYFDLSRLFGEVPLILETKPQNLPKAPAAETYAQIASDLKAAIEAFPSTPWAVSDLGRANKWSAEALMARVFLFYTGYYETAELPLVEGGSINKGQVITWLEDCIANSGYQLMPEFRNLWPYALANEDNSDKPYKFAVDNDLSWYGEEGNNKETMFALKFSTFADWGTSIYYSNQMNLFFGWRSYSYKGTMGEGWGMGTVNKKLWDAWPDNDIRKRGSLCQVDDASEGIDARYGLGTDFHDKQMDETGYWQKKYRPINLNRDDEWSNYSVFLYNATRNFQLDNMQDIVLIRFADVLLMHSELTETVDGINQVRARSNVDVEDPVSGDMVPSLPPLSAYSLEALKAERRYELAFEGVRYYDLLRWAGKSNLSEVEAILESQNGVATINNGVWGVKKGVDFRPETGGFLQIPNQEIQLSEGVLEQNPGWETGVAPTYSFSSK
ncbi:MAG: RagB/SusD family nutrient uptake outer membrane protein [Bacteroidales bacterium]|nr:RagB/SusD family nutrient uptake outer membrane protein [Bacteroidales bacterium]